MENEVFITGEYVSGIANRPELISQPCVVVYKEDGFLINILSGEDKTEMFRIPYEIVENCTSRSRVVVSERQHEVKDNKVTRDVLAATLLGPTGVMLNNLPGVDNLFKDGSRGQMDYNNLFEIAIEYRTPERNRRLMVNVYEDPTLFVEHFQTIKK